MTENNNQKYIKFLKKVLMALRPRFSFHYVAYTTMTILVVFSVISIAKATTPNPGHPWSQVGDGVFVFTNGQTSTPYTYTFPAENATVWATKSTIAAGSVLVANTANTLGALTSTSGTKVLTNTDGTITWGDSGLSAYLPLAGGTMVGNILMTSNSIIGGSETTSDLNFQTTTGVGTTGADMHFKVGNNGATEAMTILNSGKVGIGIVSPNSKLHVNDGTDRNFFVQTNALLLGTAGIAIGSSDDSVNSLKPISILGSSVYLGLGNVGIGTTSPLAKLDLAGSARFTGTAGSNLTGTADPAASTTLPGTNTLFLTELIPGDRITVNGETRTVTAIASNISLTVDTAFTDTAGGATVARLPAIFVARDSSNAIKTTIDSTGNVEVVGNIYINNSGGVLQFNHGFKFVDGVGNLTVKDSGDNEIMVFDEL